MTHNATKALMAALATIGLAGSATAQSTNATPTCSEMLDIDVHGQHVIADYVTGLGHENVEWPMDGRTIGSTVSANGGVAVAGGPGPGFHFEFGFAPGASFCTDSNSPGIPHE